MRKFHRRFSRRRPRGPPLVARQAPPLANARLALGGGASAAASCTGAAWHRRRASLAPAIHAPAEGVEGEGGGVGLGLAGLSLGCPEGRWLWLRDGQSEAALAIAKGGTHVCLFLCIGMCSRSCVCVCMYVYACSSLTKKYADAALNTNANVYK